MLILHSSNRLEYLADILANRLLGFSSNVFSPFVISVQSNGMARWLSMCLADRNGIATNLRFPFPGSLVWELMKGVTGNSMPWQNEVFQTEALIWRIFRLLGESEHLPELRAYLKDEEDLPRYQLATRIADVYDQYLVYRPDWILAWENGESDHWQARFWRTIREETGDDCVHRAHILRLIQNVLPWNSCELDLATQAMLPKGVALFGIPSLPPIYLDFLARLGQHIPVEFYQLSPTQEYAADLLTPATIAEHALQGKADTPYLDTGNRLMASLGRQWAEFQGMIQDYHPVPETEDFTEPDTNTVVGVLQSDILNLHDRHENSGTEMPPLAGPEPGSPNANLSIHVCHSPLREIEVLYDQLLALFESHPDLRPGDVAVMTPDIDAYTPFIEAIFGYSEDHHRISYHIADRGLRARSLVVEAAFRLIELHDGRYGVNEVLDLLELEPVRNACGISETDRDRIRKWVQDTQICWGIDEDFRSRQGLPANREHTWRMGLDRQLLGYAMPGDGESLIWGILPYPEAEGDWAVSMGRFQAFVRGLFRWREQLIDDHPPNEWAELLRNYLSRFLAPLEQRQEEELEAVFQAVTKMEACAGQGEAGEAVSRSIVRQELERHLRIHIEGYGFLGHGVTFCAMVPMRAIPFEVVAMIGMNDGAFPRIQRPVCFDRTAEDHRLGDRSRREDDRYLFLEAFLAARRHLYISYVGRDIQEDTPRPPSVLVSDLLNTVDATFSPPKEVKRYSETLITQHPLQAFSPRYFQSPEHKKKLFSYSRVLREAAEQIVSQQNLPPTQPPPFLSQSLPEPEEDWRTVEIDDLVKFFHHTARFLIENRLRTRLSAGHEELEEQEPFILSHLEAYHLRQRVLGYWQRNGTMEEALPLLRAEGLLPHGIVGESAFRKELEKVDKFICQLDAEPGSGSLDPVPVDLQAGPIRLVGWLSNLQPEGFLAYRCAHLNPGFIIETVIKHLLVNAEVPQGVLPETRVLTLEAKACLQSMPSSEALQQLAQLGEFYWQGLQYPLFFPPRSALAFARNWAKTRDQSKAFKEGKKIWEYSQYNKRSGEELDPYFSLAFGHTEDPLMEHGENMRELAEILYIPVMEKL